MAQPPCAHISQQAHELSEWFCSFFGEDLQMHALWSQPAIEEHSIASSSVPQHPPSEIVSMADAIDPVKTAHHSNTAHRIILFFIHSSFCND